MRIRRDFVAALPLLAGLGCLPEAAPSLLVPENPFVQAAPQAARARTGFAPASLEAAARVDAVGRKLVSANPQLGVRPVFRTIGAPQPEIFHVGTTDIDVTEGLVNRCSTEGELAAVVAHELGKMIAEREALAGPKARRPEHEAPAEIRVGTDYAGPGGSSDLTRLAELQKYGPERRRSTAPPAAPPDPQVLARDYLKRAGYAEKDLDTVAPLLLAAANQATFEKQLNPPSATRP